MMIDALIWLLLILIGICSGAVVENILWRKHLLERSDNSGYAKCPLCKGRGTMPKVDESNDIDVYEDDL
jgi:hypothetical protein